MENRYQDWLEHIFNRPVTRRGRWHFEDHWIEGSEEETANLIERTFRNSGRDLVRFSDAQVNQGIWDIASPCRSDDMFAVASDDVPLAVRLSAIESIAILYRDCFFQRCTRTLSHLDERPASPLNEICYMFWDVAPISYLEPYRDKEALADACFSVLDATLALKHPACQEASIHGYGHFHHEYPDRVERAMDEFLETPIADPRLREYAAAAREGAIN